MSARFLVPLLLAALVSGCGGDTPPAHQTGPPAPPAPDSQAGVHNDTFPYPRFRPDDDRVYEMAALTGRLVLDQGCLWVEQGDVRTLVVWAPWTTTGGTEREVIDTASGYVAAVGDSVSLSGSSARPAPGDLDVPISYECSTEHDPWLSGGMGPPIRAHPAPPPPPVDGN